jgi:Glycosyl transferase family 90
MTFHLRRSLLGQRLRLQLRDGPSPEWRSDAKLVEDIDDLAREQTDLWSNKSLDQTTPIFDTFKAWNESVLSIYILKINGARVYVVDKPAIPSPRVETSVIEGFTRSFAQRIHLYKILMERVIAHFGLDLTMTIAVDVNDMVEYAETAPLFSFQKRVGSPNILLPDLDFFWWNWYRRPRDPLAYEDKDIVAGFAGSSTGLFNSLANESLGHNPRLRAAAYFVGSKNVDFRITRAAHAADAETKARIESRPYFSRPVSWRAQFRDRFLISIDGNGAACSRLAIALKSHSAVIKYDSPHSLFYFPKLRVGRDYIAASCEPDIERIVENERARPGTYRAVAEAGRQFFARYLERDSVMAYTAAVLGRYADLHAAR